MKRAVLAVALVLLLLVSVIGVSLAKEQWRKSYSGLNEVSFKCIVAHPKTAGLLLAGSGRRLYRSYDGGKNWKAVLNPNKAINAVLIDEKNGLMYAACESGLYQSLDEGLSWRQVYRGKDKQKNILCLAKNSRLFLGTEGGLLCETEKKGVFQRVDSGLPQCRIISMAVSGEVMYLATEQGVFKSSDGGVTFEKVFVATQAETDEVPDELDSDVQDEYAPASKLRCIVVAPDNPQLVYLGTDKGVLFSSEGAKSWQALSNAGLLDNTVNFILLKNTKIYAATQQGVFVYAKDKQAWQELYKGMISGAVNCLDFDNCFNLSR